MNSKVYSIPALFEVRRACRPDGCERVHTHSDITVTAVSNGSLLLKVGGEPFLLEKDSVGIISPEQQHFAEHGSKDIKNVYVLYINLTAFCSEFDVSTPLAEKKLAFDSVEIQDHDFYEGFLSLCIFLLGEAAEETKKKKFAEWIKNSLVDRLDISHVEDTDSSMNELAQSIKKILDNYAGERAPLDEIADVFERSKIYCNRAFKAVYNLSIQAYFLNLKAQRAKKLLGSAGSSLGKVALESGFYDQSHFTRIFKEIFQMTPEEFKNAMKK
jgi:AraC-like DNA-binding protein